MGKFYRVTKYELAVCKLFAVIINGRKYHTISGYFTVLFPKKNMYFA